MALSKSQINKLGKEIRGKLLTNTEINDDELLLLQDYRTTFKDDLSIVFQKITKLTQFGRKDSIVSFRIKRIESILSKIKREPTMTLGNMGDIAGCRIILYSLSELNNLVKLINDAFVISSFNDYLSNPKDDGYNGYHFYIKSPINEQRLIEIQLRYITTHKWASLVEIIDVLYDLKLKEGQENEGLQEFVKILSLNNTDISLVQKKRIIELDNQFQIYTRLNEVFLKNHISMRYSWVESYESSDNCYFIFEVDENKKSKIYSFNDYNVAEKKYYDMFKTNKGSNFVLAHIEKPSFKKVCVAYSSYMLLKHDYIEDYWNLFAKEIIELGDMSRNSVYEEYIRRNLEDVNRQLDKEIKEVNMYLDKHTVDEIKLNGIKEWIEELHEMVGSFKEKTSILKETKNEKNGFWKKILKRK